MFQVKSTHVHALQNKVYKETFVIDESLGNETLIQLTSSGKLAEVEINVTDPFGLDNSIKGSESTQGVLALKLPGKCKVIRYQKSLVKELYLIFVYNLNDSLLSLKQFVYVLVFRLTRNEQNILTKIR